MSRIRVIRHEVVPQCGSFEVRFPDGRPSGYFYWDDVPGRRMAKALRDTMKSSKKRAPVTGEPVTVGLQPEMAKEVDDWRRKQPDLPGRPEAIRRLVEIGLKPKGK